VGKLLQLLEATTEHHVWMLWRVVDAVVGAGAGAGKFTE